MTLNRAEQNAGAVISALAIAVVLIYISISVTGFGSELLFLIALGSSLLIAFALCFFVVFKCRRAGKPWLIDYLNVGTQRYILAIFMILYGIDKLLGNFFDYQLYALDSKLADVSEFQLAWFFYGKNRWQELFTGIMEFVPGILLFHRRTYYIAAIILLPVTAQVFLLNFFFKIGGITFQVACILLACNLYILYSEREKVLAFLRSLRFGRPEAVKGGSRRIITALKLAGIGLAALVVFIRIKPAFFKSPYQQTYQALVGVYRLKEMTRNGLPYQPVADSLYYKDLYIEKQARWNILRRFDDTTEAFVLKINTGNDSLGLYINKGGIGDNPDIIDSAGALRGRYTRRGKELRIRGIQRGDSLVLVYEKQEQLQPKTWLWK